jgi:tRNA-dihydrouridine synthase B
MRPPPTLRLGTLEISPPLLLAPMAGLSDRDFRLIIRRIGGVGLVFMEFVSCRALAEGHHHAAARVAFSPEERPFAMQLYGADAETMAEAARIVETLGADVCDINMGCPANKIRKRGAGAALMGNLPLAERIISQVRRAITIPLTVKFRLGLDDISRNYLELGRICEENGVDAVVLHARTARQMFGGKADWAHVARLKDTLSIPVIGNGDLTEPRQALRMWRQSGCDAVMLGRAATRNPWIFCQTASLLAGNDRVPPPTVAARRQLILGHFAAVVAREPPDLALHKLRTFTRWYSLGLPGGETLRRKLNQLTDVATFLEAVERFFHRLLVA